MLLEHLDGRFVCYAPSGKLNSDIPSLGFEMISGLDKKEKEKIEERWNVAGDVISSYLLRDKLVFI